MHIFLFLTFETKKSIFEYLVSFFHGIFGPSTEAEWGTGRDAAGSAPLLGAFHGLRGPLFHKVGLV